MFITWWTCKTSQFWQQVCCKILTKSIIKPRQKHSESKTSWFSLWTVVWCLPEHKEKVLRRNTFTKIKRSLRVHGHELEHFPEDLSSRRGSSGDELSHGPLSNGEHVAANHQGLALFWLDSRFLYFKEIEKKWILGRSGTRWNSKIMDNWCQMCADTVSLSLGWLSPLAACHQRERQTDEANHYPN